MILRTANDLAGVIRDRRRELGLTQEELANLTGVHRTYISMVESGERAAKLDTVLRIVQTLGMDLDVRVRGL